MEVFDGNTGDPKTVAAQVKKLREHFSLQRVVLVGDRGMITSARIREDLLTSHGLDWISALRANQIKKLARDGKLQMSLFDKIDLVEIAQPAFPGERLVACYNPLLAEERARKRPDLLAATEKQLEKIAVAASRPKRPLRHRNPRGQGSQPLQNGQALSVAHRRGQIVHPRLKTFPSPFPKSTLTVPTVVGAATSALPSPLKSPTAIRVGFVSLLKLPTVSNPFPGRVLTV